MRDIEVTITKEGLEKIKKSPFWFYHKSHRIFLNGNTKAIEIFWQSNYEECPDLLTDKEVYSVWGKISSNNILVVADYQEAITCDQKNDKVLLPIHKADVLNRSDLVRILNYLIYKNNIGDKKYCYKELLFLLDSQDFDFESNGQYLVDIIKEYNNANRSIILYWIGACSQCLSIKKQNALKSVLTTLDAPFNVYCPEYITHAISDLAPSALQTLGNKNIFDVVSYLMGEIVIGLDPSQRNSDVSMSSINSDIAELVYWLNHSEYKLSNYSVIVYLFCLLSPTKQKAIIDRYFYDVYSKKMSIDCKLLEQLKDNPYYLWGYYRHCLKTPEEPVNLVVPLYLDCILTLMHSKGVELATFNGILDNVFSKLEFINPTFDIGLSKIIPLCNGGYRVNKYGFTGFLRCDVYYSIKRQKDICSHAFEWATDALDTFGKKNYKIICGFDDEKECNDKCRIKCVKNQNCIKVPRGSWTFKDLSASQINILRLFLDTSLISQGKVVKESDINLKDFYPKLISLVNSQCSHYVNDWGVSVYQIPTDIGSDYKLLIYNFLEPSLMKFSINKQIYLGKDLFGLANGILNDYFNGCVPQREDMSAKQRNDLNQKYISAEADEVANRIESSLSKLCQAKGVDGVYEMQYNEKLYRKVLASYYCSTSVNKLTDYNKDEYIRFLYHFKNNTQTIRYCAPDLSDERDVALNIPYYWCRGQQCFFASINNNENLHDLQETYGDDMWKHYDLIILSEIIGYPLVEKRDNGNQPDQKLRTLIGIVNKVSQMLSRLKCKECGHLLFAERRSSFNNYNCFSCLNPRCHQYKRSVYLNFCFHCKKGLIDSRNSQRCPNGLYICPSCLSCCNDQLFDNLVLRYIRSGKPIPKRLQEEQKHGHNDKGIFYCPKCGTQLEKIINPHDKREFVLNCPKCGYKHEMIEDN